MIHICRNSCSGRLQRIYWRVWNPGQSSSVLGDWWSITRIQSLWSWYTMAHFFKQSHPEPNAQRNKERSDSSIKSLLLIFIRACICHAIDRTIHFPWRRVTRIFSLNPEEWRITLFDPEGSGSTSLDAEWPGSLPLTQRNRELLSLTQSDLDHFPWRRVTRISSLNPEESGITFLDPKESGSTSLDAEGPGSLPITQRNKELVSLTQRDLDPLPLTKSD